MAQSNYNTEVLADNPVAFYKLDEASGLPQDSSGNGNHMTSSLGTIAYDQGSPFSGAKSIKYGDNTNSSHHFRNVVLTATDNFSIELWGYVFAASTSATGVLNGAPQTSNGYGVRLHRLTSPSAGLGWGAFFSGIGASSASIGLPCRDTWCHVVIVRDSGNWLNYFNGDLYVNDGTVGTLIAPSGSTFIGNYQNAQTLGLFSNVSFYNTALSAARIKAHYNAALDLSARPLTVGRTPLVLA